MYHDGIQDTCNDGTINIKQAVDCSNYVPPLKQKFIDRNHEALAKIFDDS